MSETERLAEELRRTRIELARVRARATADAVGRTAFETFLSLPPVAMVLLDRHLQFLKVSAGWSARTGLSEAEVLGRHLYDVVPWTRTMAPAHLRALAGETVSEDAVAIRSEQGAVYHRVELTPWRTPDGEIGGVLVLSYDTTDLVRAREQVRRSERRLAVALEVFDSLVWEFAFKERRLFTTGSVSAIFDDPAALRFFPDDLLTPVHPADRERVKAAWDDHLTNFRTFRVEYRVVRLDGSEVWVEAAAETQRDSVGAPERIVGVMRNITRQKLEHLAQLRRAAESQDRPRPVDDAEAEAPDRPTPRVLLAEDHPTNRKVVELILGAAGVDLVSVTNGAEALEAADHRHFDLILMDMQMPVMDGLTAIRALRAREAAEGWPATPILALTANAMNEHAEMSRAAGADGHITKPVSAKVLLDAVNRAMAPEPRQALGRLTG